MPKTRVNGIQMYYEITGSGEPIVWVSGLAGDHLSWMPHTKNFSKKYRCLVFDNRGAGQSEKPDTPYNIKMMADDTACLLEILDLNHVHVVGVSMGGAITQELAINHPERLRTITLVATWPKTDGWLKDIVEGWKLMSESEELKNDRVLFMRLVSTWSLTYRFYEKNGAMEEFLQLLAENPYPQPSYAFLRQADACITHDVLSRIDRIKIPTHIIVGEEDILTPLRYSKMIAERIKGSELTIIKEAGHGIATEKPRELERAISSFLEGHRT